MSLTTFFSSTRPHIAQQAKQPSTAPIRRFMTVQPVVEPASAELELSDPLYGQSVTLSSDQGDGCLIALIKSSAFERLHLVYQHGISVASVLGGELCAGSRISRWEHSVGAMLLVRRLGASMDEQLAALLHDVSHTALSHVVDNIFDGRVVHEEDKWLFLEMTDIPDILSRYGFDPHTVCNEDNFTLLEQDAPKLCADRCDYGVRDAHAFGLLSLEQGRQIINSFAADEGEIVMSDVHSARVFAESYMNADKSAWSHPVHAAHYFFAAAALKEAFHLKSITLEDFWRAESCDDFWQRCVDSPHPSVRALAAKVRPGLVARELLPGEVAQPGQDVIRVRCKVRAVDPPVLVAGGGTRLLSEVDPEYAGLLGAHRARAGEKEYLISYAA